jgi:hypothetical protein
MQVLLRRCLGAEGVSHGGHAHSPTISCMGEPDFPCFVVASCPSSQLPPEFKRSLCTNRETEPDLGVHLRVAPSAILAGGREARRRAGQPSDVRSWEVLSGSASWRLEVINVAGTQEGRALYAIGRGQCAPREWVVAGGAGGASPRDAGSLRGPHLAHRPLAAVCGLPRRGRRHPACCRDRPPLAWAAGRSTTLPSAASLSTAAG